MYKNVTVEEARTAFKSWCDSYGISVESTNPRTIDYKEID